MASSNYPSLVIDVQLPSPYDAYMSNRPGLVKQFYEAFSKLNRNDFVENLVALASLFGATDRFWTVTGSFRNAGRRKQP